MKRIVILGSTGSIGVNALGVAEQLGKDVRVVALSAHSNTEKLLEQIKRYQPEAVSVWEEAAASIIRSKKIRVRGKALVVLSGMEGLLELAQWPSADIILSAVVGAVGLKPLLKALRAGKTVALANKEALIMAGELVMAEAKRSKATLLPVDSEHSAVFQCLKGASGREVKRLVLTASGGPFYKFQGDLSSVTVAQALAHPTWKMGKKITIDSATLMNKGIETIEAAILFGLPITQVDIIIHPQSIVHSLVDFVDGATIAQLSWPDMCLPIQYAITYPERRPGRLPMLDLVKAKSLDFFEPDFSRFPCLTIAREAARKGGTYPTVLNAANETAVFAFLESKIRFTDIAKIVDKTLSKHKEVGRMSLDSILETDQWARQVAKELL
jgi:1-deoxy-D-xylulose-5-phosphate reductoisomerase